MMPTDLMSGWGMAESSTRGERRRVCSRGLAARAGSWLWRRLAWMRTHTASAAHSLIRV